MRKNSTSKMFKAFGVSTVAPQGEVEQNTSPKDIPSITSALQPKPGKNMEHLLTHALTQKKDHTPMD